MIADSMRRQARRWAWALACVMSIGLGGVTPAWAGKLTCLTGTDPSVANDAYQLALARVALQFFCLCPGSPGNTKADYVKCVKQNLDNSQAGIVLRSQCRATLLKELKTTTCGSSPSLDAVTCVKKSEKGKVSCAIKPRVQCVDKPGKFTQVACPRLTGACVDAADTNGDGLIGLGDSGACAAPVCGNGVREFLEQCDPPGSACGGGRVCVRGCYCAAPTNTPTPTLAPGQPTHTPTPLSNTPTRTPVPGAPTNTPTRTVPANATATQTPSSIGCCMNATVLNVTGCLDSSTNGFNAVFCGESQGVWINNDHCTCQSSGAPCPGSCVPGTPAPQPTVKRTLTPTRTPLPTNTLTPTPIVTLPPRFHDNGDGTITDNQTGLMWEKKDDAGGIHDKDNTYTWSTGSPWNPDGTAFTAFLATLNTPPCFAGHCDWRLPTSAGSSGYPTTGQAEELQSIADGIAPGCEFGLPCVPAAFNINCTPGCSGTGCSCTAVSEAYWSGSTFSAYPFNAWGVYFYFGYVSYYGKTDYLYVRAVR